jgi:Uma2 family endonuclease
MPTSYGDYAQRSHHPLHNGDCLTQKEFHRMYKRMPDRFKAELIGGIVYVCEPVSEQHASCDMRLASILDAYGASVPGIGACSNATVILGEEDEVQPDLLLRILPEFGGQSKIAGSDAKSRYIHGAPELVAEIAYSRNAIDLYSKKQTYTRAGVLEYIVVSLREPEVHWFDLPNGRRILPDKDSLFRSSVFPGLWVNGNALLRMDYKHSMDALSQGLSSPEHIAFVSAMNARGQK